VDVDLDLLRNERLARLQQAMKAHDLEACLFFSEPNTRYATGATAMPIWSMSTFTRCAAVPVEGTPILFEHPNSCIARPAGAGRAPDACLGVLRRPREQARVFAGEAVVRAARTRR
jgi:Xaa-Pro aminopeptidase